MSSINTNFAALSALSTLRSIDSSMRTTQEHVSTGLRVGSAADNAAYWAISTTMTADANTLGVVSDALGMGQAKVEAAYTGLEAVKDLLGKIKDKLVSAQESGVDRVKVNAEITQLKEQIKTTAQSASFSGENWLYNNTTAALGARSMVGSFTRDPNGVVSVQTITFTTTNSLLLDGTQSSGILSKQRSSNGNYYLMSIAGTSAGTEISVSSTTSATQLTSMQGAVEAMITDVVSGASILGATKARIDNQANFVKGLIGTFQKGVSNLVDADMNEESTKLKALQTQQQLAIQALSIANSSAQNIMQLFR